MPICHEKKIIFIHIPKNAGTYVEKYLNMNNTRDATWLYYKNNYKEEWKSYKKFCIVRNPIDRFISCYKFSLMKREEKEVSIPFWENNESPIPENLYDTDMELNIKKFLIEPENDLQKIIKNVNINEIIDLMYRKKIEIPFNPWAPQSFFICDRQNNIVVDEIIRYESLSINNMNINFNQFGKINKSKIEDKDKIKIKEKSLLKLFEIYEIDFINFDYSIKNINLLYW